ncbi:hypothetical protein CSKR_203902, partial [Clonorchis sinensis]
MTGKPKILTDSLNVHPKDHRSIRFVQFFRRYPDFPTCQFCQILNGEKRLLLCTRMATGLRSVHPNFCFLIVRGVLNRGIPLSRNRYSLGINIPSFTNPVFLSWVCDTQLAEN